MLLSRGETSYLGLLSTGLLPALENVILASLGALLLVKKRGMRFWGPRTDLRALLET